MNWIWADSLSQYVMLFDNKIHSSIIEKEEFLGNVKP